MLTSFKNIWPNLPSARGSIPSAGTHLLAVEKLRHVDHAHQPVPCERRLCQFRTWLLKCTASNAVLELRKIFMEKFRTVPNLQEKLVDLDSVALYQRGTIVLVAKYVYDVREIFYSVPVYRP